MILMDLSGIVLGAVIKHITMNPKDLTQDAVRHISINRILQYKKKFKKYGDVIICADNKNYWRTDAFEFYKKNRKKMRKKAKFDWDLLSKYFRVVQDEIKDHLPYIYLELEGAEADDIMAVISKYFHSKKPDAKLDEVIMIVSSDKDMLQLQKYKNIDQFSTAAKAIISNKPDYHLIEHIIRGDTSDGIPNIMSDPDTLVNDNKRQKAISADFIADALRMKSPEFICPNADALTRYKINKSLIDLDCIPEQLVEDIKTAYIDAINNKTRLKMKKGRLFTYLVNNQLRNLMNSLGDF